MNKHQNTQEEILSLLERAPGKRPAFLGGVAMDHMFSMLMELATQMWVLNERLYGYEQLLDDAGLLTSEAIDGWTPTQTQKAELQKKRDAMLRDLFRTVLAREPNEVLPEHTNDPLPPA